ncbi:hypothetical protein MJO29_003238 [Puccinia striiformis f. sp. tritici]|nr:hypothetical protein MJO29_003238 [Puccinia striiformis f. sp. tritici]
MKLPLFKQSSSPHLPEIDLNDSNDMDKSEELVEDGSEDDDDDYEDEDDEEIPVERTKPIPVPKLKITLMPNRKPLKKVKKASINAKAAPSANDNSEDDEYEDIEDEESQDKQTSKEKKKKPKQASKTAAPAKDWALPTSPENYKTFINHGTIVDDQGYPTYPNGQTVFVCLPGDNIANFGSVCYTKRTTVNSRTNNTWKVSRPKCLGALVCDNPGCQWAGSPPTGKDGMDKFLSSDMQCPGLAEKCNGTVSHLECKGTACRIDYNENTKWGLLRHKGTHMHPWPEAKKLDKNSAAKFKEVVKKNPKSRAFELKLGKPTDPTAPFNSVTSIHPSLQNKDRLAYYRRKMLMEMNLVPGKNGGGVGDKFILDMFGWAVQGLFVISLSFMPNREHFTVQTRWMSDRLFSRNHERKLYDGGLLSDVTYRYFENGYLLTTSMYCDDLERWIPVQISWIRGLTEEYYQIHFATLFRQFWDASITPMERDHLVRQVVDFSKAQTEGFISAL